MTSAVVVLLWMTAWYCARGATVRWTAPVGGSWSQQGNWEGQEVPGPKDDVIIELDEVVEGYRSLGCWRDSSNRAIPILEGKDPRLDGSYQARVNATDKCFRVARSRGFSVFAVQNGGQCFGSAEGHNTYTRYGARSSSDCGEDGEGGYYANSVYQIKAFPITVRVDSNTEIRNLHTFPNITLDVISSFTVNGNMQVDGHLKLYTSNSNEGITVGNTARVQESFLWLAGKFSSPAQGQLHVEETMQMNLNWGSRNLDTRLSGTELYIHGEAFIEGASTYDKLYISEGAKLIVTEGATLNMTGVLSVLKESTGTLVNNGSMNIHSTGTVTAAPTIYSTGDVQVFKGVFSCTGSSTWQDAIRISKGATLKLSGGTHTLQHTSTVLGSGNMDVGSRVTVSSQDVQVKDILVSSGTLDLYTASSGVSIAKIDVASRGVFNIHSHGNSSDWLALHVPEVILRSNNYDYEISTLNCERALQVERLHMTTGRYHTGLLLKVMGDVVITESWNWNGGTIQSRGPVTVNGPLMIEGDASGTAAVPELYLNGPVTTRGAQTVNINHGGMVVNRVGNVVSIRGNLNLRGNGRFLNYGEVKVEQPSPGTASISLSSFDNFGGTTVSGTPGSGLSISINHGLTGMYHVSENNVLTIVGPSTHIGRVLKDAVLTGGGTLQVNGPEVGFKSIQVSDVSITAGTVYIGSEQRQRIPSLKVTRGLVVLDESSSTTKIDDLVVTGGEVTFNRPTTIQDLEIRSGVLSGDSDITVNGTFVWTGGTLSGRLGSRITVNGNMHVAPSGTLNLNRNLVLKGKSDWVTTNLNLVLTRAFEISPGASLCVHGGGMSFTSSSSDENGAVLNYGDFIIDAPYQDLRINTQLRNYAVIQIQHGNLLLQRSSVMVGAMMNSTDKSKVVISGGNHEITSSGTTGIQEWKHTLEVNSGSLWSKDTIWSTMSVNGGDVHIDLSGGSASMDSISVTRGTLDITSTTPSSAVPTLTVQNSITVTYGQLKLLGANCKAKHMTITNQNARVEIERNLEIEDTFHWDAGTLAGTAFAECEISRTSVLGTLTVTGDSTRYLTTQSMFIHESGQWFGQGQLRLDSSAELVITEGARFKHHGGGTYSSQDHLARVVNRGTYELYPHSDVNMNVKLQNTGQLHVPDTATLSFRADSQLRGRLQADKGSVLQLLEGSHVLIDEASTFRGKLSSTSPSVVFYSNRSVEDIEVGGGQIRLLTHFSSMRVLKLTVNGGHVTVEPSRVGNSQSELSVDNVELVSGTLELNVQTRVGYLSQKGGSIRGSFDIFVEEFEWSGGSVVGELDSQLLVEDLECLGTGTKTLQQRSLILQSSGTFVGDAAGVIDINGHGNFVIAKDAQVVATAGVTIQSDLGMFENRGMLINALQGNGKMLAVSGHFRNTGTVECLDDTMMKVSGTGKWEGVLTTGSNATLELADGHQLFLSSFEVNGTGKLEVSSGSVSMQTCSISGAVMQISAPVYVQGEDHCFIQSLRVTENGVFISHSAATIELVQQIGGVVRALSSLTVAEYDLAGGTLQSHNVTEVDRLQWSSGAVTGGKLYVGVVTLSQGTDKVASRAAITVSRRCIWAEGFEETLGLQENSVLIITQEASMEVESVATLSSETGDSYQGRLENHGQINVKQTLRSSAEFVNFGNISISESKLTVTTKSENRGYIGIGKTSEVELRDHFSYPSSVIEGDGKLTLTQGTARLSTDTLKQKTLHVTGATVTIASTTGHDFSPQEVIITGGQADFVGNKGDTFELESLTIAGGRVKIHNPCNISQLTMTGGSLSIMAPTEITTFDFFAGQLVGLSELGYLTIHTLTLHNQKTRDDTEKVLQSLLIDIHRKVRWLPPSKDTMRMQDGSKIRLLSDCETTLQGQLEFQGSSETIENYGILTVYGSDEDLPHMKTSIRIDPHFNNVGTVRVQETSMVSFQSTAQISGSLTAHRNATVEFVNHHSTTPQNIKGGRLTVQNSNLWIPSTNTFTALNINSNGHVNFVSNATDPVHDSVFEEVNLKRGSVTFASDVSIAVLEITGGTVESTTPNGVVQVQQMTCQEDTESSNVQSCHVTAGDVRFVGSTVTMMSSSLRIQHSGIARSSVQVDMSNSSVLVSEGTTLAVKHKMAFRKTGLGESTLEVAGMVLVEGSQFVTSAAVVLPNTGNFTVTKDFSELDIHSTGRSAGSFNIRGSHSTITSRGPGDLVLDKGSFIGPNATINVHGGHTVITGIEHQLLENSGLRITLQGTGMMTLNSSELSETPNPLTVNEVTLRSLSSKLFLSEAAPKIQKMVVVEGQVYGDAEFGTVILQSNFRLADCNLDVDHLIISGNNNDNKEMQASKINVLASLRLETDATIAMSQGSVLRLAPSAICSMDNALEITASDVDSAASWFINEGRMTVKLGAGREASIGAKFNHSGELVVEDGHLTMTNDSFIRGRLQVNTGSRLTLSSGVYRIESGSSCLVEGSLIVESAAFVEMESDDISIESATSHGTVSLRGETCISGLELADGHFEVGGNAGIGALDMSAATLSVRGDVTVNGPVKWQSGTIQLSAGSSLTVNGDFTQAISEGQLENQGGTFTISPANPCGAHTDCTSCQGAGDCSWYPTANLCVQNAIAGPSTCSARNCRQELACSNFGTAEACSSQPNCTWCLATDMCVQHEQCPSAAAFWGSSAGGEWHTASNWFNDTIPGESSDAFLSSLSEDYEVRITTPVTVEVLEIGSQCDHAFSQGCDTTQTLNVQRDLQVGRLLVRRNARLIFSGDNLIIGSSLTVEGAMEWRKGTIRGNGNVNLMGTLTIPQDCYYCSKNLQVPLENYGRITLQTTRNTLTMSAQVNITNVGEILIKSNGVVNGGTIYNEGLIFSTTPTATINSNMVQNGKIFLRQSTLQLGGNAEFSGATIADEGSELLLKSGIHTFAFGSTLPSSLTVDGGTTVINTTGNTIKQLHLKNSATLQSDKDLQVDNVFLERGSLLGQGDYQINTFSWREGNIEGMIPMKRISVNREMTFLDDRYYSQKKTMAESTFMLNGRAVVQGSQATLTMSRNASFEVTPSGELHVPTSTTLSLRCSDGTCGVANYGSLDVLGSSVITTELSSSGRVSVDGRIELSENSDFENGQIWVGSSGTLHLAGNQKRFNMEELVEINVHGTLSVGDGALTVSSQNIAFLNDIHCSGGSVRFTNTTNLQTIGTVYARNAQFTLQTGHTAGLSIGKIDGRYRGDITLASPTTASDIVLQENSNPGATVRLDSPHHAYRVLNSITLNEGQHKIEGTVFETGTKPTLYVVGQMNLQHFHRHFYFQNVDVSIGGTVSHTCRNNYNYGVYLTDSSTLTVEETGRAEIGGCNWYHSGSLPTSFINNGVLTFNGDPTSIHTTFVQNGAMYTTTNKNLHLHGQSILQGNVTIGENAAVNFRGGSQHHLLSDFMLDDSSTFNVFDSNTVLNVSTDELRLSKINVNSEGGRLVLLSRNDAGSVNRLEVRRGSIQVGISQLTTDEIFLTTGDISGNEAHVWTRKATLHDTDRYSFVLVANLTVSEKLLISKSSPSHSRQVTIDSSVAILPSATMVAVTRFDMYGEGEILNEGNFRIDSNDDQWLDIRLGFVNRGHLQVTNRLVFNSGGSNHGEIRMVPTSKLYLRSSKVYNMTSAGEIFGSGTIYMDTDDPVVYLSGKDDSMESSGKDIGLVVSRGRCYADFRQAQRLVQRISISRGSIEITASASNPPHIAVVNFLPDYDYNTFVTCTTGTEMSIGKLTLRQYRSSGHFGHGCGVTTSNMIWYSGVINRPAYLNVIGHLDIKHASGYKRIIGTNMSITATAVADADSTIYMADGSRIDINGSFSSYNNLRFQREGSGTPQLVISGHVRLLQRGKTMTVTSGVSVINYGTIEVLHGTLSIPSTDCHSGTFVVAKGALLQFNSGVTRVGSDCSFEVFSASISGNSRLDVVDTKSIPQYITISSGTLVLNPNSNTTVDTLNVNGNVEISGQFRVRKFNLNSGNMEVNGLVIITDEMAWSGGNLMSNQMHVDGNLYLTSSSTKYLRSGTLVATGTVTSKDSQTLQMQGDAVFELQGSMGLQDSLRIAGSGQNAFLNAGIIKVQAGLNEYGLIVDVNFNSPGVIMVESGKMKFGHSNRDVTSTLHGNLTVKEQANLEMGYGEFTFANQSLLNVSGTMAISSAQVQVYSSERMVTINNVKMTSSGTLETSAKDVMIHTAEICSGTLWIHRSAKIDTLHICGGRLRPGRSVNVTELLITSGDVFSSSARPKIVARRMGWGGGRVWANEDTTTMTIQVTGRLHVFGSGSKYGDYDTVIRVDGQFTMISVGNLYLSRSALIQLDGESTASLHHGYIRTQYSPPGRFTNMGDITIGEYSKATTVALHVPFQMLGKIAIKQGQINIASGGRFSGSTEIFMDGRLEVTGGTLTATSGSISGPGNLYVSGGILSLDGGEVSSPITITRGTLQVTSENSVTTRGTVRVQGGTLNVDGYLECLQDVQHVSGSLSGSGIVRVGNQSKILIMSTQSSDRRTTSVRSLQIFGLLEVSSALEVSSPGVVRNEEEGQMQMIRSGAITGTGRVENYGRLITGNMHPDVQARISSNFENFWIVEPDNSSLIIEPRSTAVHKISSRVLGGVTTWKNGVTIGGVSEGSVIIQGNCYVGQATVFSGHITWRSGSISLQEDQCSTRSYDSSGIMRSSCSEKYVLNTGEITLDTSSDKAISTGVDLVNKGNIKWLLGKMVVEGNVKNLASGKFEITDTFNADRIWQNSGNTLENSGILLLTNARCLFQDRYGTRRGLLHNKGMLSLREESYLQIDTLTSGGDDALLEMSTESTVTASQIIIERGTAYLQGQVNGRLVINGGKLNPAGTSVIGSLSIEGSLTMSNTSVLEVDLVSPLPSAVSDTLTVSSDVELHGKLTVSWNPDDPTPSNMDTFPIIAYGGSCRIDGLVTVSVHDNVNFNTTCGDSFITVTVLR